ncbi:hypothetical protein [Pseudomonas sp. NMI795_08]|uniref:hypothetical protein n=1 Tax=Pseudomonas sp. NMI795_08 TaxID=2903144 RepID=UPI001E29E0FC|nr:hypothetical protein [Pseudomonas sp. NMI795_08]MCE1117474.1 hypothetical protein [Pseudomonas sp. NMI795_08]
MGQHLEVAERYHFNLRNFQCLCCGEILGKLIPRMMQVARVSKEIFVGNQGALPSPSSSRDVREGLQWSDPAIGVIVKRTIQGMIEAGAPLIQKAIAALRQYHEAQAAGEPRDK